MEDIEYFQEQGLESDKCSEVKGSKLGEDRLNAVKGR